MQGLILKSSDDNIICSIQRQIVILKEGITALQGRCF
jgi:hypothetical protein